jgi:hypothetical protein
MVGRALVTFLVVLAFCQHASHNLLLFAAAETPACASSLRYWETYETLTTCLRSNPVNEDNKAAAISSLRLAIQNYAFVDIAKSPPDQSFVQPVDLSTALDKVAATTYSSDADLQEVRAPLYCSCDRACINYILI